MTISQPSPGENFCYRMKLITLCPIPLLYSHLVLTIALEEFHKTLYLYKCISIILQQNKLEEFTPKIQFLLLINFLQIFSLFLEDTSNKVTESESSYVKLKSTAIKYSFVFFKKKEKNFFS